MKQQKYVFLTPRHSDTQSTFSFPFTHPIAPHCKVKQPNYRPGQALRVPGGSGSQITGQSAHGGGKFVSLTHRPPLPTRKYLWYSFLLAGPSGRAV